MAEEQNRSLQDKFMLRLPDGMRERIKAAADANNRSMNAEIVATLEEVYPAPQEFDPYYFVFSEWRAAGPNLTDDEKVALSERLNIELRRQNAPIRAKIVADGGLGLSHYMEPTAVITGYRTAENTEVPDLKITARKKEIEDY